MEIDACKDKLAEAFGGLDKVQVDCSTLNSNSTTGDCKTGVSGVNTYQYGTKYKDGGSHYLKNRKLRPTGVATEIYNQIIDSLATQCRNVNGRFLEQQFLQNTEKYNTANYCQWHTIENGTETDAKYEDLRKAYGITSNENMCPRDYALSVDIQSWGVCSCWENGGRRSKNGRAATCLAVLPAAKTTETYNSTTGCVYGQNATCSGANDTQCYTDTSATRPALVVATTGSTQQSIDTSDPTYWCKRVAIDTNGRVCPATFDGIDVDGYCHDSYNDNPGTYFNVLVPSGSQN